MRGNLVETAVGAVVVIVAAVFLAFAFSWAEGGTVQGYELTARFNRVDGVRVGSDVLLSGIKVGTVIDIALDTKDYEVEVRFSLDNSTRLPVDSTATIGSSGLLSDNYVALVPGGAKEMLGDGDEIQNTSDAVDVADLLSKIILIAVNAVNAEKKESE
jgi:phospholipid/cholesterol/gamma-HCH transport system substrate-binding protein